MPNVDITQLLSDPDFCEPLSIIRTTVTVGDNGRQVFAPSDISPPPSGVVQPIMDDDLVRTSDEQHRAQRIKIWTMFRLSGPAPNQQPDRLTWGGDTYVIVKVKNWTHFGAGYVYAEAESIDFIDESPE